MDRRRFISSAGLLSAVTLAPLAAGGCPAAAAVNPRLSRLIALHDRAKAACTLHYGTIEEPTHAAWRAEVDAYPVEAPPPHEGASTTFVNAFGDNVRLSTAGLGWSAIASKVATDPSWADMGDDDWRQAHLKISDACARREAVITAQKARRAAFEQEARARWGVDAINARGDALADRRNRLWQAAMAIPAASVADIAAKLCLAERTDPNRDDAAGTLDAVSDDIRRLAAEAQS